MKDQQPVGHMRRHDAVIDSEASQALRLNEIEELVRALGWRPEHEARHLAIRRHAARGPRGRSEWAHVPNATRTSWGRWIDTDTGEPLTVADLTQRLEAAGYDEHQLAIALALVVETGKVS